MLTLGVDFKCNAAICFGIGPVHEQLKTLQRTLNAFASVGRFTPLDVDGFIGDQTVAAVNRVANALGLTIPGTTRETVTANAPTLIASLTTQLQRMPGATTPQVIEPAPEIEGVIQQIVAACRVSKKDPTCAKAATLCSQVRGTPSAALATEICSAVRGRAWLWWVVGGVAAATGIGLVVYHRKRP